MAQWLSVQDAPLDDSSSTPSIHWQLTIVCNPGSRGSMAPSLHMAHTYIYACRQNAYTRKMN